MDFQSVVNVIQLPTGWEPIVRCSPWQALPNRSPYAIIGTSPG
jgi:hypothetical protein